MHTLFFLFYPLSLNAQLPRKKAGQARGAHCQKKIVLHKNTPEKYTRKANLNILKSQLEIDFMSYSLLRLLRLSSCNKVSSAFLENVYHWETRRIPIGSEIGHKKRPIVEDRLS